MKKFLVSLFALGLSTQLFGAAPDAKQSLVSIVTYKEGIASSFAHNHFIVAPNAKIVGDLDPKNLEASSLSVSFPVSDLVVDEPTNYKKWLPFLSEQNLLTEASKVSESDRKDITGNMLGEEQLNAVTYPTITGLLNHLTRKSDKAWSGTLELNIHGEKVTRAVTLTVNSDTTAIINEAYLFTDFKISPFSAMLGAIRVKNNFNLVVKLVFPAQTDESKGDKS